MNYKKNIAEVAAIEKDFDGTTCTYYWRAQLWFNEEPNLKVEKCEVVQDSKLH